MNKTCLNLFILVDFVCSSHREVNFVSSEFKGAAFLWCKDWSAVPPVPNNFHEGPELSSI